MKNQKALKKHFLTPRLDQSFLYVSDNKLEFS